MIVHIFVDEADKDILEHIYTAQDKMEFKKNLPHLMIDRTFKMALVSYESGSAKQINSMQDLIDELGKFGI